MVTYTGTKGSDLDLLYAPNRTVPGSLSATGPVANAGNFIYDTSGANSIYNSLQVRLQKRLSHGIMINGTYTYAKSIDDASSIGGGTPIVVQDSNNLAAEYGLSSFDIRHQARINYLYELPFGQGHRFAQKGMIGAFFGNWRFSGNFGAQTGTPYTAEVVGTSAANVGSGGVFATRADQICNPNVGAARRTAGFLQYRLLRGASGRTDWAMPRATPSSARACLSGTRKSQKLFCWAKTNSIGWIFAGRSRT